MKKIALLLVLLLGLLPAVALAQDATEPPTPQIPPLAGEYTVQQGLAGNTMNGTVSIAGTGPIYTLTAKADSGSDGPVTTALAQGDVLAAPGGPNCSAATLVRQSDGTLFGQWVDTSVSDSSLGLEYYIPTAATTDFAGSYDVVGTYANGDQYKSTVEITKNAAGIYSLTYTYTEDEADPSHIPGNETGIGLANGNVLGYAYTETQGALCGALVIKFAADGSFSGEFTADAETVGQAEGKPKA